MKISKKLIAELKIKEYRDAFVSAHIDTVMPFQIRALRKQRGWTQKELAERVEMKQERISALENPNYSKFTITTLKKIASAFDVALIVRFASISELVQWELALSPEKLEAVSFEEDPYFQPPVTNIVANGGVVVGGEAIVRFTNPSQVKPELTDMGKYREARQKEMERPSPRLMQGAQQ